MAPKKTHEQFVIEMKAIHPNIEILEEYKSTHTKARFKCTNPECGHEWITTPHQILDGVGCPACRQRRRRTHEMFVDELKSINPNIEITSKFKNFQTKVDCKCLIDNHQWSALPQALLLGHGCRKCSDRRWSEISRLTQEEFMLKVAAVSPNTIILEEYKGSDKKVLCQCKTCGHTWETVANNILNGKSCPACANAKKGSYARKTLEIFCRQLSEVNPDIEIIGEYINSNTPIKCRCRIDGTMWHSYPNNLLKGAQCPKCRSSLGEKTIAKLLDKYEIIYDPQHRFPDCKNKRTLPFDFYLPEHNICVEFDGEQHFRPVNFGGCSDEDAIKSFTYTKQNDSIKNQYCKDNNINLIRIKYDDLNNAENYIQKIKNC